MMHATQLVRYYVKGKIKQVVSNHRCPLGTQNGQEDQDELLLQNPCLLSFHSIFTLCTRLFIFWLLQLHCFLKVTFSYIFSPICFSFFHLLFQKAILPPELKYQISNGFGQPCHSELKRLSLLTHPLQSANFKHDFLLLSSCLFIYLFLIQQNRS